MLTKKSNAILKTLHKHGRITATEIGTLDGVQKSDACNWAIRGLKPLLDKKYVKLHQKKEKTLRGTTKIIKTYSIMAKGKRHLKTEGIIK